MSGGYRTPVPPIFARALAALDGLDKLAKSAAWRMKKRERRAIEAAAASITELRDELKERNAEIYRVRRAIGTLADFSKVPDPNGPQIQSGPHRPSSTASDR